MGGSAPSPAPEDNTAMLAMIKQQGEQQAAAAKAAQEAQDRSIYNTQVQAANQAGYTGSQQAQQQLGLANQYQQAKDAASLAAQQAAYSGAGSAATGGAYDIGAAQKNQLSNLGAASGYYSPTAANLAGNIAGKVNPAFTTAGSMTPVANKGVTGANQFTLPYTSGVTIG